MNLVKQQEYFDPINDIKEAMHIIGCGAIGSTLATMLARMGIQKIHLYDFDKVETKNICNQCYYEKDVEKLKVDALAEQLLSINSEIEVIKHPEGWEPNTRMSGYIFLAVDSIETRKAIVEDNLENIYIKAMFDFRMRLTDAQHYAADFKNLNYLLSVMDFTHEEAKAETPVSACGTELNVITTVQSICSLGLSNFINFVKKESLCKMIIINLEHYILDAFRYK